MKQHLDGMVSCDDEISLADQDSTAGESQGVQKHVPVVNSWL